MSQNNKQIPSGWSAYERGRTSSVGSLRSINETEIEQTHQGSAPTPQVPRWFRGSQDRTDVDQNLQRRPSVFNSLRQMGGINNIDNFARSFQRAQAFRQITPIRRGSVSYAGEGQGQDEEETIETHTAGRSLPTRSLLRQQFEAANAQGPDMAISDAPSPRLHPTYPEISEASPLLRVRSSNRPGSIAISTHTGAELGTSYGSISSRLTSAAQRRASVLIHQHYEASMRAREAQEAGEEAKDELMERQVEYETREDGEVIERLVGESTVPMTIFNSINVLVGIGILALPLAMKYSGWVIGISLFTSMAFLTNYTAKLLAKCLDTNSGSTTYGDLAYLAFGDVGRAIVEAVFVIELLGANIAMLILFGDSMFSLIPSISVNEWKTFLAIVLIPLNFVPFKTLSLTSILGIACTIGLVIITFADGFIKPQKPGSLRDFMPTSAFPADFRTVPLAIGLWAAPWGGHSVFPAVYKDMRHPKKYGKALVYTYIVTYGIDLTMIVFGYLMFGDVVLDEVTTNILRDTAYPKILSVILVVIICIIPITKIPLSNRPIMDTVNKKFMIDLRQMDIKAREYSEKSWKHRSARATVGIVTNLFSLLLAILVPGFDAIMATLGASVCLLICAILPMLFYLRIFSAEGKEISRLERVMNWTLITVCTLAAVIGTVFAVLPKEKIGAAVCKGIACLG